MKPISRLPRCLFLLLLMAALAVPAQAQLIRGYGVKGGLTNSDVRSPALDGIGITFETKRRNGLAAFAFVEWLSGPLFTVVTEAGYVQRGFTTTLEVRDAQNNPVGSFRADDRLDYLSFAALAKVRRSNGRLAPYALAGPHLDFFLGGDPDEEGTLASSYATTAFGGTVGVGIEAALQIPAWVFLEIRYSFDVTNSLPDVPRDAYNNAFDVLLGIRL